MEIQCPHCASRFNLPEHLARPGAKLRCSVCKTVFALQLPEPAPAPIPDLLPDDVEQPRPRRRWLFWLMLLLLLACGGAAVYWYCWHERPLTPVQGTAATAENIALLTMKDVRQYYVNNEKMGKILVIEGRVVNEFPQPVSMITVEAVLYGQDQKVIASNRQTAGNQLTPLQLSVLDKEAMASRLARPRERAGGQCDPAARCQRSFHGRVRQPAQRCQRVLRRHRGCAEGSAPAPLDIPAKLLSSPARGFFYALGIHR